jgi:hypothetical protein
VLQLSVAWLELSEWPNQPQPPLSVGELTVSAAQLSPDEAWDALRLARDTSMP